MEARFRICDERTSTVPTAEELNGSDWLEEDKITLELERATLELDCTTLEELSATLLLELELDVTIVHLANTVSDGANVAFPGIYASSTDVPGPTI